MGPVALFDKSFLQSLNLDESVWFDKFFMANIPPLFYIETLADLDKEMSRGKTAEEIVGRIAEKTPQMSGVPNISHLQLLLADLMGHAVSMTNRPIVGGGRRVVFDGKVGVNFDVSPETQAFNRWQAGEYQKVEREFAKFYRARIKSMTFENSSIYAKKLGIDISLCKNIKDAASSANQIIARTEKPYDLVEFIINTVGIPHEYQQKFVQRYQTLGFPPLSVFAPYAAHVIKIEIFFHICVSRGFISADRPSNKIDIAYLHYLPFCQIFVSGDNLHRSTAPLFMSENQRFVWGPDLKNDLAKLNMHYMNLPQEVKDKGVISFASKPPTSGDYLTAKLWDLLGQSWRQSRDVPPLSREADQKLFNQMKAFENAPTSASNTIFEDPDDLDNISLTRIIHEKRGNWYQVSRDLKK